METKNNKLQKITIEIQEKKQNIMDAKKMFIGVIVFIVIFIILLLNCQKMLWFLIGICLEITGLIIYFKIIIPKFKKVPYPKDKEIYEFTKDKVLHLVREKEEQEKELEEIKKEIFELSSALEEK